MRNLIVGLLIFSGFSAQAKIESNYTLTPASGQHEVTPGVNLLVGSIEYKNDGGDVKAAGANLNASYFYGFTDFLSAGVTLNYSTIRTEYNRTGFNTSTTKGKGLGDPVVSVKGNLDLADLGLYYSVGYGIAAQKSKYNNDNDEYNMASGQNSYRLAAGLAVPVSDFTFGAILNYQKNLKGKETQTTNGIDTENDLKESSSHVFKLYWEFMKEFHLTGTLVHQRYTDLYQGVEFSARFPIGSQFEIIPQATTLVAKHPEDLNADTATLVYLGSTFRFLF